MVNSNRTWFMPMGLAGMLPIIWLGPGIPRLASSRCWSWLPWPPGPTWPMPGRTGSKREAVRKIVEPRMKIEIADSYPNHLHVLLAHVGHHLRLVGASHADAPGATLAGAELLLRNGMLRHHFGDNITSTSSKFKFKILLFLKDGHRLALEQFSTSFFQIRRTVCIAGKVAQCESFGAPSRAVRKHSPLVKKGMEAKKSQTARGKKSE